jgi:hypothetical protein
MNWKKMKAEDLNYIHRYFDKVLDEEELTLFRRRVAEDADFAREVKKYTGMIIGIRQAAKAEKNQSTILKFAAPLAIAASILIIISVGYYFYLQHNTHSLQALQPDKGKNLAAAKDSLSTEEAGKGIANQKPIESIKIDYLADNYRSNPTLDELIKQNYRSAEDLINIKAPRDSTFVKINTRIRFIVDPLPNMQYRIIVYDNDFNLKYESMLLQKSIYDLDIPLPLGLYYWKVKCPKQSMWGGRLYVVK